MWLINNIKSTTDNIVQLQNTGQDNENVSFPNNHYSDDHQYSIVVFGNAVYFCQLAQ